MFNLILFNLILFNLILFNLTRVLIKTDSFYGQMNAYATSIDFSLSLEKRLQAVERLSYMEREGLLEHVCSAQMITPLFIYSQYLQYLILREEFPLLRRIRIAELCDLGWTALYLLTRIPLEHERMRCIEWFSNPYLKLHAYNVLFHRASLETQIQILKNMHTLPGVHVERIYEWFIDRINDETLEYKLRSNCADALLNHSRNPEQLDAARKCLGIDDLSQSIYQHRENVHLFVPNVKVLEQILQENRDTPVEDIVMFIKTQERNEELFWKRIVNDKTVFAIFESGLTLEKLICKVWGQLTDELRKMLIDDIYDSENSNEEWMCTTGYYNRIINVYQIMITDRTLFESQKEFNHFLHQRMNYHISQSDEKEDIILELPESGEEKRIRYLTFKIHALPQVLDELKQSFPHLSDQEFEQCFSIGLRHYESSL